MSTREMKLGCEDQITLLDEDDFIRFNAFNWYRNENGYVVTDVSKPKRAEFGCFKIRLHRLIMLAPDGMDVDHINGNKLDNRKVNLRICTRSENLTNKRSKKDRLAGAYYRGQSRCTKRNKTYELRKKWFSRFVSISGEKVNLGTFFTEQEAHEAYKKANIKHNGEFSPFKDEYENKQRKG